MNELRVPSWLAAGVLERYQAGASHLFLLHGNVRDVHPFGPDFVPLTEGLRRLSRRRPLAVTYDVSSGLGIRVVRFPDHEILKDPDAVSEAIYAVLAGEEPSPES